MPPNRLAQRVRLAVVDAALGIVVVALDVNFA